MKKAFQQPQLSSASRDSGTNDPERFRLDSLILSKLSSSFNLDGLSPAGTAFVVSAFYRHRGGPILWITRSNQEAEQAAENLNFFLSSRAVETKDVLLLPGSEADPYRGLSPHPSISTRRAEAFWMLTRGFSGVLITSLSSVLTKTVGPDEFSSRRLGLEIGSIIPRDELIATLRVMGYVREDPVRGPGEFSYRGGIIDFFSPSQKFPYRLDFFGDEIESIREFDPSTQRSVEMIGACEVTPTREVIVTSEEIEEWHRKAPGYWKKVRFGRALEEAMQFTGNGELFNGFEYLFPLVMKTESSVLDFLPKGRTAVVLQEPDSLFKEATNRWRQAEEAYEDCQLEGTLSLPPSKLIWKTEWLQKSLESWETYRAELLSDQDGSVSFDFRPERKYRSNIREILNDLSVWREKGEHVAFVMSTEGIADRLVEILREYDLEVPKVHSDDVFRYPLSVTTGHLTGGFFSPSLGLHLLTQDDVFGETSFKAPRPSPPRSESLGSFLSDFRDLKTGDYVVHVDHGIGLFKGLQRIGVGNEVNEFVLVEYAGGSKLYVPIDRLDLIQKYSSGGDGKPSIDRLGGTSWKKTKARIKKSMQVLADDLLKLYAKREVARGHAFSPDDELSREFEEAFEYEETPDQASAILASKEDMESKRPMDRLICGDVGYGKTEVAMRAAFKAVNDGKQVAILAPTTVLAFQHFNTFTERFKGFPVKVEMLSRFLSRSDQKIVIEKAALGEADILIGTHRILSKDVEFLNLGLIVVDEEQRFGVAQKEKLKKLKAQVDVLTLSATPIPRTLNMSLVGIRDLSIIETPPKDRLAIQTAVMRYSKNVIRSAIDLELKRDGQVFFVHNSVETLYSMAQTIQQIVPEARIGVAHGQMKEAMLEEVMLNFLKYHYDVLACTTIIENGLDIPRANTIIVNKADRFGLSQLYQLRGRVGRSNRRAYAYLLISTEEVLTTDARKRLAAIREFSDLGSGFRLAALDLEIRGAGNLLGGEQSGHISAVGFELYVKLLEQAVRELRGEASDDEVPTTIDLRLDIQIPEHYIADSNSRLWLYKRISSLKEEKKVDLLNEEIQDRFGQFPRSVSNLLEYARIRLRAQDFKITSIERKGDSVAFKFGKNTPVQPTTVIRLVEQDQTFSFTPDGSLAQKIHSKVPSDIFQGVHHLMDRLWV